ncbi:XdhC family protein [Promicromonospora sukumoe]|uniref:XdhC family protein n=1 Tax=Promicromonospora sukumoe TaxID=88382 RepID=UPI0037C78DF9
MRDLLPELLGWWRAGDRAAVATVVRTFRSAPREPGAALAVGPGGEVIGSVSGGCVEGAVYDLCLEVAETGAPVLARYGVTDDDAFDVGLTCGGTIEILVVPLSREAWPGFESFATQVLGGGVPDGGGVPGALSSDGERAPSGVCLATVVGADGGSTGRTVDAGRFGGPLGRHLVVPADAAGVLAADRPGALAPSDEPTGRTTSDEPTRPADPAPTLGDPGLDAAVTADAVGQLTAGVSAVREYGPHGERTGTGTRVFLQVFAPPPRLLVFGAIDFAAALARAGRLLGYRVTVCDARPVFATSARFPEADEVVTEWPHRYLAAEIDAGRVSARDAVCVLTHDPKFDVPLLHTALTALPSGTYVGAMGSRRAHTEREARLIEDGVPPAALARLRSPIGLDLGARTPDETAVSIAAEMIAARSGASTRPLSETNGPIHG